MPGKNKYLLSIKIFLVFLISFLSAEAGEGPDPCNESTPASSIISYSVINSSWLSLQGTTNVNTFECFSAGSDFRGYLVTDTCFDGKRVDITGAEILVNVKSFDCKNPLITRDMHDALGGRERSGIKIKLSDAILIDTNWNSADGYIMANILISINGILKAKELKINWQRQGYEYSFEGTAELSMAEFDIEPPSPALGIVRVNDNITVNFNYNIRSGEISRLE